MCKSGMEGAYKNDKARPKQNGILSWVDGVANRLFRKTPRSLPLRRKKNCKGRQGKRSTEYVQRSWRKVLKANPISRVYSSPEEREGDKSKKSPSNHHRDRSPFGFSHKSAKHTSFWCVTTLTTCRGEMVNLWARPGVGHWVGGGVEGGCRSHPQQK